jgi:hypothetical protein
VNPAAELKDRNPQRLDGLLLNTIWNMALCHGIIGTKAPTEAAGPNSGDVMGNGDQGKIKIEVT